MSIEQFEHAVDNSTPIPNPLDHEQGVKPGIALCLSGGGYRAMLFHVGTLWRLNEAGLLPKLDWVSSVSGGSITAGVVAQNWRKLSFTEPGGAASRGQFETNVVNPIRTMAAVRVDLVASLLGLVWPTLAGQRVAAAYRKHLFGRATLQDLPDCPRFVFNATNLMTGVLWRFSKPFMADYRVGEVRNPEVDLAQAVAASSAFPPFLSPVPLRLDPSRIKSFEGADLHAEPYTRRAVLTDGGVYDNLGLQTAWNFETILVSDGAALLVPQRRPKQWLLFQLLRVLFVTDNQVRAQRKKHLIDMYRAREGCPSRRGAYWGIGTKLSEYGLPDALPCPIEQTARLAAVPTRLTRMDPLIQERLINWGYAVCDAAVRSRYDPTIAKPQGFPYPHAGVGDP